MDTVQQGIVTLLRSAITGERLTLPEGFQLAEAMDLVHSHGIATLIYQGGASCGIPLADPAMQQLFRLYCLQLRKSEGQLRALKTLFARFEEEGIDYLPLKGTNLKALYPQPEMRPMGDADVLIRMEQYWDKLPPVMEALGYQFHTESDHELIWKSRELYLELHKRLIPSYNAKFHSYFGDGWSRAERREGCRYAMTPEDEYLYLITHFTKHYRDGGIGLRHLMDLWVYRRAHPQMDQALLRRELKKLGILEFYENLRRLMGVWFQDETGDEVTDFLAAYLFASGSWGQLEQHILSEGLRSQKHSDSAAAGRLGYLWSLAFPRRTALLGQYPILNRCPWLLPGVWVYRILTKVLSGNIQWETSRKKLTLFTRENLSRQRAMLEFVGLKDRF